MRKFTLVMRYGMKLVAAVVVEIAIAPYPTKAVRVIVGLAPGGATDIQARLFTQKLAENLGQPFIVDNRDGAGGLIAYETVKNASPDGYTVLAATPSYTVVPALHAKRPYDPIKDFAPVSLVTKAPYMIIVTPSLPVKTMQEFIAYAKAKPGALNFAISGIGTTIHLGAVWLDYAGAKLTIIPYKGTGPATTDVIAGQVHATFANVLSGMPHVKAGRVRVVAVTTPVRSRVLPDIPTVAESGIPGFDVNTWHGWLAPRSTPAAIVNKLNAELARAVRTPDIAVRLEADGGEILVGSPAQFSALIADEVTRWNRLVKQTGLKTVDEK
jgi:tripartite-type tricarboxylate transporter receptor subunit TctC